MKDLNECLYMILIKYGWGYVYIISSLIFLFVCVMTWLAMNEKKNNQNWGTCIGKVAETVEEKMFMPCICLLFSQIILHKEIGYRAIIEYTTVDKDGSKKKCKSKTRVASRQPYHIGDNVIVYYLKNMPDYINDDNGLEYSFYKKYIPRYFITMSLAIIVMLIVMNLLVRPEW